VVSHRCVLGSVDAYGSEDRPLDLLVRRDEVGDRADGHGNHQAVLVHGAREVGGQDEAVNHHPFELAVRVDDADRFAVAALVMSYGHQRCQPRCEILVSQMHGLLSLEGSDGLIPRRVELRVESDGRLRHHVTRIGNQLKTRFAEHSQHLEVFQDAGDGADLVEASYCLLVGRELLVEISLACSDEDLLESGAAEREAETENALGVGNVDAQPPGLDHAVVLFERGHRDLAFDSSRRLRQPHDHDVAKIAPVKQRLGVHDLAVGVHHADVGTLDTGVRRLFPVVAGSHGQDQVFLRDQQGWDLVLEVGDGETSAGDPGAQAERPKRGPTIDAAGRGVPVTRQVLDAAHA